MKVNKVDGWDELDKGKPGDFFFTTGGPKGEGAVIRCPKCGRQASFGSVHTIEQREPLTLSPSLICPFDDCKNHYFIKAGEVVQA